MTHVDSLALALQGLEVDASGRWAGERLHTEARLDLAGTELLRRWAALPDSLTLGAAAAGD